MFLSKSVSPTFLVENLLPSTSYTLKVWTYNSNGATQPSYISTTTLNVPDIAERKLKETEEETSLVWLGVFVGMPVLVVVFVVAVMSLDHPPTLYQHLALALLLHTQELDLCTQHLDSTHYC